MSDIKPEAEQPTEAAESKPVEKKLTPTGRAAMQGDIPTPVSPAGDPPPDPPGGGDGGPPPPGDGPSPDLLKLHIQDDQQLIGTLTKDIDTLAQQKEPWNAEQRKRYELNNAAIADAQARIKGYQAKLDGR